MQRLCVKTQDARRRRQKRTGADVDYEIYRGTNTRVSEDSTALRLLAFAYVCHGVLALQTLSPSQPINLQCLLHLSSEHTGTCTAIHFQLFRMHIIVQLYN